MLTEEDLQYRKDKIGASDASIILGINPWKTPLALWEEKLGLRELPKTNTAMQRGNDLEDHAREEFKRMTGIDVKPRRIEHKEYPWMMATYDGITDCNGCIVEIKVPNPDTVEMAKKGKLPIYYYAQMQHQIEIAKPLQAFYFCYDHRTEKGYIVDVKRCQDYIDTLLQQEKKFYDCMITKTSPEVESRDYNQRTDDEWTYWANIYRQSSEMEKIVVGNKEESRKKLISLAGKLNSMGGGIKLSQGLRKGNVDIEKLCEDEKIDKEKYRKPDTEFWRIIDA